MRVVWTITKTEQRGIKVECPRMHAYRPLFSLSRVVCYCDVLNCHHHCHRYHDMAIKVAWHRSISSLAASKWLHRVAFVDSTLCIMELKCASMETAQSFLTQSEPFILVAAWMTSPNVSPSLRAVTTARWGDFLAWWFISTRLSGSKAG